MRLLIVVGDTLDHGGIVDGGSPGSDINGKPIARVGDRVTCALHGSTIITSGDRDYTIDGKPVARHGDKTACGGTLISIRQDSSFTEGPGGQGEALSETADNAAVLAAALANKPPICEECLRAANQSGAALLAR